MHLGRHAYLFEYFGALARHKGPSGHSNAAYQMKDSTQGYHLGVPLHYESVAIIFAHLCVPSMSNTNQRP